MTCRRNKLFLKKNIYFILLQLPVVSIDESIETIMGVVTTGPFSYSDWSWF